MRFKLILCFQLCLFLNAAIGQETKWEAYTKAVDYCACKITYEFTKAYAATKKEGSGEVPWFSAYGNELKDCSLRNSISCLNLKLILREEAFNTSGKQIINGINDVYSFNINDSIFNRSKIVVDTVISTLFHDDYSGFWDSKGLETVKDSIRDSLKIQLKAELDSSNLLLIFNEIEPLKVSNDLVDTLNSTGWAKTVTEDLASVKSDSNILYIICLFLLTIALLLIVLYFKLKKTKEMELDPKKVDKKLDDITSYIDDLKDHLEWIKGNINRQEDEIKEIKKFLKTLPSKKDEEKGGDKKDNNNINDTLEKQGSNTKEWNNEQSKSSPSDTTLFAPPPNDDGTFTASAVKDKQDGLKFYLFTIKKTKPNEASFEFINEPELVSRALARPDEYLSPVCEEDNILDREAKNIRTIKPGRAVKKGDRWVVNLEDKALINYE